PHGPHEILDGGRYGPLVPVGDAAALADAALARLAAPRDAERLRARGAEYSVARPADGYLDLIARAPGGGRAAPRGPPRASWSAAGWPGAACRRTSACSAGCCARPAPP